jgi:hypothetical protein
LRAWGADIAPAEAVEAVDAVDCSIGAVAGADEIAAERCDAEHAAAIGDEPPAVAAGAGMENLDLGVPCRSVEAADLPRSGPSGRPLAGGAGFCQRRMKVGNNSSGSLTHTNGMPC